MNNNNNQFDALDIFNILSFLAQMENMNKDEDYHKIIHKFFLAINEEIKKLHVENDIIINQNKKIISLLEDIKQGGM